MITYRRAEIADIDLLVEQRLRFFRDIKPEIDTELLREPNRAYYAQTIPTGECVYWLAFAGNQVVGGGGFALRRYAPGFLLHDGVSAYAFNIFTEPEFRKRGIAKEIMTRLMNEAKSRGIALLDLHATKAGLPIYQQLGFQPPEHVYLYWTTENEPS